MQSKQIQNSVMHMIGKTGCNTRARNKMMCGVMLGLGLMSLVASSVQAATPLSDSMLAQPIKGLGKFNSQLVSFVQQDVQQPAVQQQIQQNKLAALQSQQYNLNNLTIADLNLLGFERLERLANQTREQRTPNDLFVAQLDANTFVQLALDNLNITGQEVGVENVKGTIIVKVQVNP